MAKRIPKPHQKEAITASIKHFKNHDKGRLIMACGTGKTLTALWIAEILKAKRLMITVPSLNLSAQNLDQWQKEYESIGKHTKFLCVCSDQTVGHLRDEKSNITSKIPVTTDIAELKRFVAKNVNCVIITTYASSNTIIAALKSVKFDIAIYDEAHRTAGTEGKFSSQLIYDENISAKHKLFMTATERIYSGKLDEVVSMDDEMVYGKKFYELDFRTAIRRGILCDYEIKIVKTDSKQITQWLHDNPTLKDHEIGVDDTTRSIISAIMLYNEFKTGGIHRCITYHNTIRNAQFFNTTLNSIASHKNFGLKSFHINGTMNNKTRAAIMNSFVSNQNVVLTNSRTLTEGVDIPNLDTIAFVDQRNSVIDIAQALGRAIRPDKKRPDKKALVLIPIVDESARGYAEIVRLLRDLTLVDSKIQNAMQNNDYETLNESIKTDTPKTHRINLKTLLTSIKSRRIIRTTVRIAFPQVEAYVKKEQIRSHADYMKLYDKGKLPLGFPRNLYTDFKEEYSKSNIFAKIVEFGVIKEYCAKHGITKLSQYVKQYKAGKLPDGFPVSLWVSYGEEYTNSDLFRSNSYRRKTIVKDVVVYKYCLEHEIWSYGTYIVRRKNMPENFPASIQHKPWLDKLKKAVLTKQNAVLLDLWNRVIEYCKKNKIERITQYAELHRKRKLPKDFPRDPSTKFPELYKKSSPFRTLARNPAPFATIVKFCNKHKLKTATEYIKMYTEGKLPKDFPKQIYKSYPEEYKKSNLFMATKMHHKRAPWHDVYYYCRIKKIKNVVAYKKLFDTGNLPKDFIKMIENYSEYQSSDLFSRVARF